MQRTKYDWQFSGKSEFACKAAVNETCRYAKGKMLGGTSSLNGMIYTRGNGEKNRKMYQYFKSTDAIKTLNEVFFCKFN